MLNFLSFIVIFLIAIFLLFFKGKSLIRKFRDTRRNLVLKSQNSVQNSNFSINLAGQYKNRNYYEVDKSLYKLGLRKEMLKLFKGNKKDKIKSLEIASKLADRSTLKILKMGLKDMDPDIVELSAKLISKFK